MFLPQHDEVPDNLCGLILVILRDQVVLSICQATKDCYVWVLLDDCRSRVFYEIIDRLTQEGLNILGGLFEGA
ncbi:hypothetical protein IHE45_02G030800 [Dioscorea alata]|uniref:Uncharacterized protein n=1 Tax=Dioscorea alata TaxID=55571 RepID=A0ACB7WPQ2_DIOAL|nr:hypothetical protein IHE45_02G030800 [Dioscorea alata]